MEYVCHRYTYIIAFLMHTILLCIHIIYELEECSLSGLISLVNACTLKDLCEYIADLILKDLVYVVRIYVVLSYECLYPVVMLCDILVVLDVSATRTSASSSISPLSLAGSTASPITSMSPMFSFLML